MSMLRNLLAERFAMKGGGAGEGPSIFTAIEEQLDLKLVADTAPIDVLVIDSISQPSPN